LVLNSNAYPQSTKHLRYRAFYQYVTFCILLSACIFLPLGSTGQIFENPNRTIEQQLENATEKNNDTEIEDDEYVQRMVQFLKNPININTADEEMLKELQLLTPIQIQNCISYRNLLGKFISVFELQAIPKWDIELIEKIKPYIIVSDAEGIIEVINHRLKEGSHTLLTRLSQILEPAKGYSIDSNANSNYYLGSALKLLLRYKYQFKNLLQYGALAEKDAGEQFFKGKQKQGFDFYSVHFFARNIGVIQSLALGDFTVNLAQGLTQWQSLAFKKSAAVLNIKREGSVLRPYNSVGEINFHRGVGITLSKKRVTTTVFLSNRKVDGNVATDSIGIALDYISSLQTSGYHRTKSETDDKGKEHQFTFGGNISWRYKTLTLGLNTVQYKLALPLQRDNVPYNIYALQGSTFGNYSIDYSYTFKNVHFFGEAAVSNKWYNAFVNGLLISVSAFADMSLLYRNISAGYQSLYSNAFTENTLPTNERGVYMGLSLHLNSHFSFNGYADLYKFPWLKYNIDAPSSGADYLFQVIYTPTKQIELLSCLHTENKASNFIDNSFILTPIIIQPKKSWRTQFIYKINSTINIKSRVEIVLINQKKLQQEQGFLTYFDLSYQPYLRPYSANFRVQYFESDGYRSRLYAYENDILYNYTIPNFYEKGARVYINIKYNINKSLTLWSKLARSVYSGQTVVGSGLDEIKGNVKTEFRVQLLYKF